MTLRLRTNTKIALARNIRKVAEMRLIPIRYVTRRLYLETAQDLNLRVIRGKGKIHSLGGFTAARKKAERL